MQASSKQSILTIVGPGVLVAATGVGAGDLATATLAGAKLGTAILWAVLVGALLKYTLNEGLTRWQLATGSTILEGSVQHLGKGLHWCFKVYLILWSYLVAMALMSACGIAAHAILPLMQDASHGKILYGILHSLFAAVLVVVGGYKLFERVMAVCIGGMFLVIVFTAVALLPPFSQLAEGLFIPTIPKLFETQPGENGLIWTVALLGGVGGTVTILCYGYWIREETRTDLGDLTTCRIDLAVGYGMTAIFGLAMVVIGSQLGELDAKGTTLVLLVAETLETRLGAVGPFANWAFKIGAWGAIFSSLLGVWQSVPYLFTDSWGLMRAKDSGVAVEVTSASGIYRLHLALIATLPISGLIFFNFATAMMINGVMGALFIPMLSAVLLYLNNRADLVGASSRNGHLTNALLGVAMAFFLFALGLEFFKLTS